MVSSAIFLVVLATIALYCIFCLVQCADIILQAEVRRNMVTRIKLQLNPKAKRAKLFEVLPGYDDEDLIEEDYNISFPTFAEIGNISLGPIGGHLVDIAIVYVDMK